MVLSALPVATVLSLSLTHSTLYIRRWGERTVTTLTYTYRGSWGECVIYSVGIYKLFRGKTHSYTHPTLHRTDEAEIQLLYTNMHMHSLTRRGRLSHMLLNEIQVLTPFN